ncbi:MAG: NIPSNAP family protein [Thermoguttaceae bacterium]|nr:NIPSNAP family protein [Thermoguttaceae bacterium]
MFRRNFLKTAAALGVVSAAQTAKADLVIPGQRRTRRPQPETTDDVSDAQTSYILLETYAAQSVAKRDELLGVFDEKLIPDRNKLGFDKIGVFYVDAELMKGDRGYEADKFDAAVFVVQESFSVDAILKLQKRVADEFTLFNQTDDLQYVDQEMTLLQSVDAQPRIAVPYTNAERLLQLRTYNSPNYERNFKKVQMFESGELDVFKSCGMNPVFMGTTILGSWIPNITYMLSFENDEARREGWGKFGGHPEWKKMSQDPQFARTATRIRNLFLRPSQGSQI